MQNAGAEVSVFTAQSYFYDYYNQSLLHKALFKFSLSGIIGRINKMYRETVERIKPDVVWVFKGMEITPESVLWTKNRGVRIVNYNPDNPFIFSGPGSGNRNVTDSIPLYDLHFTYNLSVKARIEKDFRLPVHFLPFGFDLDPALYESMSSGEETVKMCFAGNPDAIRAKFIRSLAEAGICIDVYGNNWDRFLAHANVTGHPPVYAEGFWDVLHRYRVQLNLMRIHNPDSHNMRSFEVPGAGGIMLAPRTREHEMFFEDGKEAFFFKDEKETISLVKRLLAMTTAESSQIRSNARRRSIDSGYSYQHRAEEALQVLQKLCG